MKVSASPALPTLVRLDRCAWGVDDNSTFNSQIFNLDTAKLNRSKLNDLELIYSSVMTPLIDREAELSALEDRLSRPASMSLIYGQRRVGKTFLLQHLLTKYKGSSDCLYFLADESTASALLLRFHREVAASGLGGGLWSTANPSDWGTAFSLLAQSLDPNRRVILVLDELQYLLEAEPALASILQRVWDTVRPRGGLHLILCGSALGTLGRLGDQHQPLHGRFDLRMKLLPFSYREAAAFLPSWEPQDRVRAYSIFGGLARHLAEVDPDLDLATNARRALLDPLGPLHEAPLDLLRTERVAAHAAANAVLAATASGENRFNSIAARTGLKAEQLSRVLDELIELEILVRDRRFGDRPGSRFARYRCRDPLVTFWFRCIQPQRSALVGTPPDRLWSERIEPKLDDHMGPIFENVVRQALEKGLLLDRFGPIDELAPWWSRDGQTEIDLIVRSGEHQLFVECKWRAGGELRRRDLEKLRGHAERSGVKNDGARFALATVGGFSDRLRALADAGEVLLIGLDELFEDAPARPT